MVKKKVNLINLNRKLTFFLLSDFANDRKLNKVIKYNNVSLIV